MVSAFVGSPKLLNYLISCCRSASIGSEKAASLQKMKNEDWAVVCGLLLTAGACLSLVCPTRTITNSPCCCYRLSKSICGNRTADLEVPGSNPVSGNQPHSHLHLISVPRLLRPLLPSPSRRCSAGDLDKQQHGKWELLPDQRGVVRCGVDCSLRTGSDCS